MILVDTSIWVDHFRASDAPLARRLERGEVLVHPFVIGELALGRLHQRDPILSMLRRLPSAVVATNDEMLLFVDRAPLVGSGLGWVDAHLLLSARLTAGALLWTSDRRLFDQAARLGLAAAP